MPSLKEYKQGAQDFIEMVPVDAPIPRLSKFVMGVLGIYAVYDEHAQLTGSRVMCFVVQNNAAVASWHSPDRSPEVIEQKFNEMVAKNES